MTAVLCGLALPPATAAEALREGDPEAMRVWDGLVSGEVDAALVGRTPEAATAEAVPSEAATADALAAAAPTARREPRCLLPGSFNPVYEGHRRMLALAAARLGAGDAYELAIPNPDKPPLSPGEAARRLARPLPDKLRGVFLPQFTANRGDPHERRRIRPPTRRPFSKPRSGRIVVKVVNRLGDEVMKVFRT